MTPAEANREALRLRDELHLSYEVIATRMASLGVVRNRETWRVRLCGIPRVMPERVPTNFTEAYRASLAVGYDPLEALDAIYECSACHGLPCVCRRAVA